jgi:Zn-finger nucleic acid-binding protein
MALSMRVTCPGCQASLAMPDHLAGRAARCPRCHTDLPPSVTLRSSEAISAHVKAPRDLRAGRGAGSPLEAEAAAPDARIQVRCPGCGGTPSFPASDMGTVQECPVCGGYLDIPELTRVPTGLDQQNERYERQMDETDRQLEEVRRQQEQGQRQLDRRDQLDAMEAELVERASRLLQRWEDLAGRIERVVERLEREGGQSNT